MFDTPFDTGVDRPVFLVESYAPGHDAAHFRRRTAGVTSDIEILHAAYVPSDDTAYWLVRADTDQQISQAWQAAGCRFDRVLAAVLIDRPAAAFDHPRDHRSEP